MSDPLATYLHDHLAGSKFGIDLLGGLRDQHSSELPAQFASTLLAEVESDRETLQRIIDRIGKGSPDLKEAAAWLTQKVSRFKLSHDDKTGLGTFQALETLALGIVGKLELWRALEVIAETDDRLRDVDFAELAARASSQHARVEEARLMLARIVFSNKPGDTGRQ